MTTNIEAIYFDFGGVMAVVYIPDKFRRLEEKWGFQADSLAEILWRSPEWRMAEAGTISDAEYWRRIAPRLGLHTPEAIQALQHDLFDGIQADPRMVGLVRKLGGRYRLGLLSNTSQADPQSLLSRHGLEGLFEVVILSAAVELSKPDPAIFHLALERMGAPAGATVFVDDYEPNVRAAAALGIRAIHFVGYEELLGALRGLGVDVTSKG